MRSKYFFGVIALMMLFIGSGCSMDYRSKDDGGGTSSNNDTSSKLGSILYLRSSDIDIRAELITDKNDDNVLKLNSGEYTYMYYKFTKRGNASSNEADYSGSNAAILARDTAKFILEDSFIYSSGDRAHGVFSFGEGTTVNISDCAMYLYGTNSGGLMTSAGGVISAKHVTAETYGTSSPAIYAYDSGGSITVERGRYATFGAGSPVIRSNSSSAISVSDAKLESGASQAVILDGESSLTITSCDVTANHSAPFEGVDTRFQSVLIYNSGSGNETGTFTMSEGKLTSDSGDVFYVTNATAEISLSGVDINKRDSNGAFIRAEASTLGTSGANGGRINFLAENQNIYGNVYLDGASGMNMYLVADSYFAGAVNTSDTGAKIFVSIENSKWVLTDDSYIDSLTCGSDSISLNGNVLYVAGVPYTEGTASTGTTVNYPRL